MLSGIRVLIVEDEALVAATLAAGAGNERRFLGFGGVAVSGTERATLAEIAAALNTSGAAPAAPPSA